MSASPVLVQHAILSVAQVFDSPDDLCWLTLEQVSSPSGLTWMVRSAWRTEWEAERAAGFHDSPAEFPA